MFCDLYPFFSQALQTACRLCGTIHSKFAISTAFCAFDTNKFWQKRQNNEAIQPINSLNSIENPTTIQNEICTVIKKKQKRGKQTLNHETNFKFDTIHKKMGTVLIKKWSAIRKKDKQAFLKGKKYMCRHALRVVFIGSNFLCPYGHSPIDFWH